MQAIIVPQTQVPVAPGETQAISTQVAGENSFAPRLSEAITAHHKKSDSDSDKLSQPGRKPEPTDSETESSHPADLLSAEEATSLFLTYPLETEYTSNQFSTDLPSFPMEQVTVNTQEKIENTPPEVISKRAQPVQLNPDGKVTPSDFIEKPHDNQLQTELARKIIPSASPQKSVEDTLPAIFPERNVVTAPSNQNTNILLQTELAGKKQVSQALQNEPGVSKNASNEVTPRLTIVPNSHNPDQSDVVQQSFAALSKNNGRGYGDATPVKVIPSPTTSTPANVQSQQLGDTKQLDGTVLLKTSEELVGIKQNRPLPVHASSSIQQPTSQVVLNRQDPLVAQQIEDFLNGNEKNTLTFVQQPSPRTKAELPGYISGQPVIEEVLPEQQKSSTISSTGTNLTATLTQTTAEKQAVSEKPFMRSTALRQDIHGQHIAAKISSLQENSNTQNQQQNLMSQGESTTQQESTPQSINSMNSPATETSAHFSATGMFNQESQATQATGSSTNATAFTTPSTLPEDTVINQVIQRFQVKSQLQNSKMVIKLHPAELGELKIDIAVKNGSVKANFLAQSQHVQEILEKQMPKLREIMEQQGVTVDDILVTLDADSFSENDFLQEQFSKDSNFTSQKQTERPQKSFDQSLEQLLTEEVESESGINVKV